MTAASTLRPERRLPAGLSLLLIAQLFVGLLRISIVPLGHNVDEVWHFGSARNVFATCLRSAVGLDWTLMREPDTGLQPEQWELLSPDNPDAVPCSLLSLPHYRRSLAYYLWVSVPMAIFNPTTAKVAVDVGRAASLLLGLAVTALAYRTSLELFPGRRLPALAAALTMSLNHHLAGIMVGVNTDAGATFVGSALLWSLSCIYRQGFHLRNLAFLAGALALIPLSKTTAWSGVPIALFWLWARLPPRPRRWSMIGALLLLVGAWMAYRPFTARVPAHWFVFDEVRGEPTLATTIQDTTAPAGERVFVVDTARTPEGYVQYVPEAEAMRLRVQEVTFGGWIWVPSGVEAAFPALRVDFDTIQETTPGNGRWQFRAMTVQLPATAAQVAMLLPAPSTDTEVRLDGLVLAPGTYPLSEPPIFSSAHSAHGRWGGATFVNRLRNASAEQEWPSWHLGFELASAPPPNQLLWSLLSWARTGTVWTRDLPSWLFVMFWSGFSGTQPGLNQTQMLLFVALSFVSLVGLAAALLRLRAPRGLDLSGGEYRALWLLVATAGLVWLSVLYRAEIYPHRAQTFAWAGARYALPGVFPTLSLHAVGMLNFIPRRWHRLAVAGSTVLLFVVSTYILLQVQIPFYDCPELPITRCLTSIR